jgi:hypothetical protein
MNKVKVSFSEITKKVFVGDLPKGLYIMEIECDGKVSRNKLIIQ